MLKLCKLKKKLAVYMVAVEMNANIEHEASICFVWFILRWYLYWMPKLQLKREKDFEYKI